MHRCRYDPDPHRTLMWQVALDCWQIDIDMTDPVHLRPQNPCSEQILEGGHEEMIMAPIGAPQRIRTDLRRRNFIDAHASPAALSADVSNALERYDLTYRQP